MPPLISVIVPAYNEGPDLSRNLTVLARFLTESAGDNSYELLLIDDGSTDATYEAAQMVGEQYSCLRVIRHISNKGLGCAIRTGFAFAEGDVAVVYDSDMSYAPAIITQLLAERERCDDDLVLASPYMRGGSVTNVPLLRRILSREGNRFLSFATNGRFFTLTCMVRAYRLSFFNSIESIEPRMEINPELAFKAIAKGARVGEIPAHLVWTAQRAKTHGRIRIFPVILQSLRTMRYGVAYRPAVLMALPGILPGVLPSIIAICVLLRLDFKTIAAVMLVTMIVQNASLALFAGQLAVFGHNVFSRRPVEAPVKHP